MPADPNPSVGSGGLDDHSFIFRFGGISLLVVAACSAPLGPPPTVHVAGCEEWTRDGTCQLGERELTLWVSAPEPASLSVTQDGERLEPSALAVVQDGLRFRITPKRPQVRPAPNTGAQASTTAASASPERGWSGTDRSERGASGPSEARPAGVLEVRIAGRASWSLKLVPHATVDGLVEVARLRRGGDVGAAQVRLAQLTRTSTPTGARGEAARNALAAGRLEEARALFLASIAEAQALGHLRAELRDRTALAYLFLGHGYPASLARAQLEALAPIAQLYSEAASDLEYFRLLFASRLRLPRLGFEAFRRLREWTEKLDNSDDLLDARQMQTALLVVVGRWDAVLEELEPIERALQLERGRSGTGRSERGASSPSGARSAEVPGLQPCREAELRTNVGWYRLLGHRQTPSLFPEAPTEMLARAAELYRTRCEQPLRLANAELNLGWAFHFRGNPVEARARLIASREASRSADLRTRLSQDHLQAELELAAHRPREALAAFVRLRDAAELAEILPMSWRARVGIGESHEALGQLNEAIDAYAGAEAVLPRLVEQVRFGEGRDSLLFELSSGAEKWVKALTRAGRGPEAIAAIRTARLGALRWAERQVDLHRREATPQVEEAQRVFMAARAALDEAVAESWALPATALAAEQAQRTARVAEARDALDRLVARESPRPLVPLSAPRAGEAALFVMPDGAGLLAWLVTAEGMWSATSTRADTAGLRLRELANGSAVGLEHHRIPAFGRHARVPSEARSAVVLDIRLRGVRRLSVYAHPALEHIDWAGWRVDGAPLYERAVVVFQADLGGRGAPPEARGQGVARRAVVLADLAGALPEAREEGARVANVLRERGWQVSLRSGVVERRAVLEPLKQWQDLLHYSGHGVQGGVDGLDSGIPVGASLRFTAADVVGLARAPRRVILAACELGGRGSRAGAPGLGLAHAWLLWGSEQVIAAVRPVRNTDAEAFVQAFYAVWTEQMDWPEAMRAARIELAKTRPEVDASVFKLWVDERP